MEHGAGRGTSAGVSERIDIGRVEGVVLVAEFTVDLDGAFITNDAAQFFLAHRDQRAFNLAARTGASEAQRFRCVQQNFFLVKEIEQEAIGSQREDFIFLQFYRQITSIKGWIQIGLNGIKIYWNYSLYIY